MHAAIKFQLKNHNDDDDDDDDYYRMMTLLYFYTQLCDGGPVIDLVKGLQATDKRMKEEHIAYILKETIKVIFKF